MVIWHHCFWACGEAAHHGRAKPSHHQDVKEREEARDSQCVEGV
jgi:hypothetical protein